MIIPEVNSFTKKTEQNVLRPSLPNFFISGLQEGSSNASPSNIAIKTISLIRKQEDKKNSYSAAFPMRYLKLVNTKKMFQYLTS